MQATGSEVEAACSATDGDARNGGQQGEGPSSRPVRLLSIVEALTVTGPVKPLLMFAPLARRGLEGHPRISQQLLTTRRSKRQGGAETDELMVAAAAAGLDCGIVSERRAFDPHVLVQMVSQIRQFSPDIVETHDCKSHFLFYLLRLRYRDVRRAKWLAFHHGYTHTSWKIAAYQQLDRLTLRHAQHVVTVCQPFAATLSGRGVPVNRLSVISNPVSAAPSRTADQARQLRRDLTIGASETVILSVGRLSAEKGHRYLVQAFREVSSRAPEARIRLVFVGDGPEREYLSTLCSALGDRVLFVGHQPDPWAFYGAADIFVLCSLSEGSPLVLLEAMATGLPIIATAVGGIPETIEHENTGLLVPPADHVALADALISLVSNPPLRNRLARAAAHAVPKYSAESYAQRLLSIYAHVLRGG
jgi:glycosyltransferase involved in cell wall biosynthesis